MADVGMFFERLNQRGNEYLPEKVNGSIRFDLYRGEQVDHWLVAVKRGNVFVSRDDRDADTVVRMDFDLFERLVGGDADLLAMLLRNELSIEGNLPLLLAFRRSLPSVPGAVDPRRAATSPEVGR